MVKLCGLSFYIKAYFSVQLMLICAVVNCKCAVVIGNLYSCNYSFLCSFPSVEQYLQKFSKQRNFAFGVQECLVMRFSSGFDSVFDYYKSCRTSSTLRYSTFPQTTEGWVTLGPNLQIWCTVRPLHQCKMPARAQEMHCK